MNTLKQFFISVLEAIQQAKAYKAEKYKNIL